MVCIRFKIFDDLRGHLVTFFDISRHHFDDNIAQLYGNFRIDLHGGRQFPLDMFSGHGFSTVFRIRELAGEKLIKGGAQTVNIAADVGGNTGQLFRTDILWRSHNFSFIFSLHGFTVGTPGQSQVGKFGKSIAVQHDIIWFDVLMNKFLFIPGNLQRRANFFDDLDRLIEFEGRMFFQDLFKSFSPDILHGKVKDPIFLTYGIGLDDIGMCQFGCGPCFSEKSFDILLIAGKFIVKHFQGDRPVE